MSIEFYLDDSGFYIELDIVDETQNNYDISAATVKEICFVKPNGTEIVVDADFVTNGTDGKIRYLIPDDFLDVVGKWKIYCHIAFSDNNRYTSKMWFQVK